MRTFLAVFSVLLALPVLTPAQDTPVPPFIPPGFILVDDMILPEDVFVAEGAYVPSYWPFGGVPYAFAANVTSTNQARALAAMAELEAVTAVDFFPRTNQVDYVLIMNSTVNSSPVGQIGGAQGLNVVSWGEKFVIVHELMHALGFIHEQCRPDRGSYVTINSANISTTACTGSNCVTAGSNSCVCNFNIVPSATATGAYDFRSLMHYGRADFSTNGSDTITCNSGYTQFQTVIGNRSYISLLDAQGLQTRYGSPLPPSAVSVSPASINAGSGDTVITVTGTRFCGGTTDLSGVPGTVVRWNGANLATTFLSPNQVSAIVPSYYLGVPVTGQVTVQNPAPGGGVGTGTLSVNVVCPAVAPLALAAFSPQALTSPCTGFSIPTPPSQNWHVIGVSSPSDWDMNMGPASSTQGGSACDFLAGDGYTSPGQVVNPTSGTFYRYSGTSPATAEYVTPSTLTIGSPLITSMPAGSIIRAFRFNFPNQNGPYSFSLAGPQTMRWWLVSAPATYAWQTPYTALASGYVGYAPTTVSTNWLGGLCLIVGRDGGAAPTYEPLTINICTTTAPLAVGAGGLPSISAACQPFSITPQSGRWNAVGISSTTDWDIYLGPAASEYGGNSCDYVVANGRLGTVWPTTGQFARYSGTAGASAMFPVTVAMSSFPGSTSVWTSMMAIFEFDVPAAGNYNLAVNAGSGYQWELHGPGNSPAWRRRIDRISGTYAADGTIVPAVPLQPGWNAVVVFHNGGPTSQVFVSMTASQVANPVPGAITVTPHYAVVGGPTTTVNVDGTNFLPASVVHWNGSPLATAFVSATQLQATIPGSLIQVPSVFSITVVNPAPGGGASPPFTFSTALPVVSYVTPASIPVMTPVSAPVSLSVWGNFYLPTSVVFANGQALPTAYVSAIQLTCSIGPSIPQALRPGGICINVHNTVPGFSNSGILEVGGAANQGNIYLQPLAPLPGQTFALALEWGAPGALYSLFVDLANPPPLTGWPTPAADMILAVGPITGSPGPIAAIVDGIGFLGPPQGTTLNSGGHTTLPGFVLPNPALNLSLTAQGLYLDPASPVGFRLTWARYPIIL